MKLISFAAKVAIGIFIAGAIFWQHPYASESEWELMQLVLAAAMLVVVVPLILGLWINSLGKGPTVTTTTVTGDDGRPHTTVEVEGRYPFNIKK